MEKSLALELSIEHGFWICIVIRYSFQLKPANLSSRFFRPCLFCSTLAVKMPMTKRRGGGLEYGIAASIVWRQFVCAGLKQLLLSIMYNIFWFCKMNKIHKSSRRLFEPSMKEQANHTCKTITCWNDASSAAALSRAFKCALCVFSFIKLNIWISRMDDEN